MLRLIQIRSIPVASFADENRVGPTEPVAALRIRRRRTHSRPRVSYADIENLECGQEFLMQQINRLPTRADRARATLGGMFYTAVLVLLGIAVFWPHGL